MFSSLERQTIVGIFFPIARRGTFVEGYHDRSTPVHNRWYFFSSAADTVCLGPRGSCLVASNCWIHVLASWKESLLRLAILGFGHYCFGWCYLVVPRKRRKCLGRSSGSRSSSCIVERFLRGRNSSHEKGIRKRK